MKKLIYICITTVVLPFLTLAQVIDTFDYIAPFHDGIAAVKKGNEWAFINETGVVITDFRTDFVPIRKADGLYPMLHDGRVLIRVSSEDHTLFGFADAKGEIIIEPQYINALNFEFGKAVVTRLIKNKLGFNKVMGKPVVSYDYQEIVIDTEGNVIAYLTEVKPIPNVDSTNNIPNIRSKVISEQLAVTKTENNQLILTKLYQPVSYLKAN